MKDGESGQYMSPATALEASEAQHLFAVVQRLAKAGIGTIFISHQLTEVLNLCSAVTVLRDGQVSGTLGGEARDAGNPR
jgi:ABC-type sugar transport system ATPase subunit